LSLCLFAIPALSITLLIGDMSVMIGVVGYAVHWSIPINVMTIAMAIAGNGEGLRSFRNTTPSFSGNALTTAIIAHFCYHFANAGPRQKSGQKRVQYAFQVGISMSGTPPLVIIFQSCLIPAFFACLFPLISYLPLFVIETPIILHIWKMLVLTCTAAFAHFLFFLPG
jgi:hypothetical protein